MFQTQKVVQTIVYLVIVHKKDIMTWRVLLSAGEEFSLKLHVSDIFESIIHRYLLNVWSVGTYQLLEMDLGSPFFPRFGEGVIYAKPTGIKY